jgi:hypothetical protein
MLSILANAAENEIYPTLEFPVIRQIMGPSCRFPQRIYVGGGPPPMFSNGHMTSSYCTFFVPIDQLLCNINIAVTVIG